MYQVLEEGRSAVRTLELSYPKSIPLEFLVKPEGKGEIELSPSEALLPTSPDQNERKCLGMTARQMCKVTIAATSVNLLVHSPALLSIGALSALTRLAYPHLKKTKHGRGVLHLLTAGGVAVSAGMALSISAPPAQAAFFVEAETFLSQTFDLSGDAVTTMFNVFRAAYVVYLIYSAVMIWAAINREDDWMSVAKAPFIVFIGGTLIDAVTMAIVQ